MSGSLDCLCAGIIVADSVCQPIAMIPRPGTLALTDRVELTIGGCAANVAVDLTRLGLSVGVSGRVGADVFGREVRDLLLSSSVACEGLLLSQSAPTSTTFVLNVRGEDRRFIHCIGANAEYDGSQITLDDIRSAKVLYVGGFGLLEAMSPERVIHLFRMARELGVVTILDVVLPENGDRLLGWIQQVLPWTDYFFPNSDEAAQLLSGETDPRKQSLRFLDLGARTVIITCGSDGAVLTSAALHLNSGVYPVDAVDATGTGDAFVAGFVYGLLSGSPPARCLQLGTAMGASCVRCMGATTGVFNASELSQFVESHPLQVQSW